MPEKTEALGILLLLIPGFVCAFLVQLLAIRAKQTEFEKIVEAILFSSILYLCVGPFFHNSLPVSWLAHKEGESTSFSFTFHAKYLALLGFGAILLSLVYGTVLNYDLLHKLLRRFKLTERTSVSQCGTTHFKTYKAGICWWN